MDSNDQEYLRDTLDGPALPILLQHIVIPAIRKRRNTVVQLAGDGETWRATREAGSIIGIYALLDDLFTAIKLEKPDWLKERSI